MLSTISRSIAVSTFSHNARSRTEDPGEHGMVIQEEPVPVQIPSGRLHPSNAMCEFFCHPLPGKMAAGPMPRKYPFERKPGETLH